MSDQEKRRQRGRTVPPRQLVPEAPEGCSIVDEVCAADKQWFLDHPGETEYLRPYVPGEMPMELPNVTLVKVVQLSPGIRNRQFLEAPQLGKPKKRR